MPLAATADPVVAGTVRALVAGASRALVRLADGQVATVCREQVTPLVPLDRVLAVGTQVEGTLDPSGQLHLDLEAPSEATLAVVFPDGVVTPALVTQVAELGGELALHPAVRVRISRSDVSSNPKDRIDTLLEVGETVPARVFRHSDGTIRLRLIDVDDDEPIQPALSLLPGGPEWIEFPPAPQAVEPEEEEAEEAPVEEQAPHAEASSRGALRSAQLTIDTQRATIARLEQELAAAGATSPEEMRAVRRDLGEALHQRNELAGLLKEERTKTAELRRSLRTAPTAERETPRQRRLRADDLEAWVRDEIAAAWLERVAPGEREQYPLGDYAVGDGFAASLEPLDDDRLDKAFRAAVDVLTGRAATMPARAVHALRRSESGGSPDVVRGDGARCMRCAIENDTPSARRLHWWRLEGGRVELSRVVLHDDMNP